MRKILSLLALFVSASVAAHADTVYTSESAFLAANPGLTTVGFNGIAPANGFVGEGTSFSIGGAQFSSSVYMNLDDANYYPFTYPGSSLPTYDDGGYLLPTGQNQEVLTVSFNPSTAVGVSLGGLFGPTSVQITLSDGYTTTISTPDSITGTGALDFAGFTSSTPITSYTLTFATGNTNFSAIDNVTYGTAATAVTPEPSSLVLLATGLTATCGAFRRRLRR
jgi:hypothetical protein